VEKCIYIYIKIYPNKHKILKFQNYRKIRKNDIHINVLVRKPERKKPLWRPRRRRKDNIKMGLPKVECEG